MLSYVYHHLKQIQSMLTPFVHHKLQFQPVDPLGDGLGDDIAREQSEEAAAEFQQDLDGNNLAVFWDEVEKDVQKDPNWFTFTEE